MVNRSNSRKSEHPASPVSRAPLDPPTETYVQTVPQGTEVSIVIGSRREGVPGGWHSGFNRVYDWYYFAHLSPAAKAIYKILEWRADYDHEFKVSGLSHSVIADHAGISVRSIQKPMSELLTLQLVTVTEREDRASQKSKTYCLLVPMLRYADLLNKLSHGQRSSLYRGGGPFYPPPSTSPDDEGGRSGEGRVVVHVRPASSRPTDPVGSLADVDPLRPGAPHNKKHSRDRDSKAAAASLLEESGVERSVSAKLAATYSFDRISDVVETMQWRRSRGKCENPGGFIRDALVKQWEVPKAVLSERAKREGEKLADTRRASARHAEVTQKAAADQDEALADRAIARLDDEELEMLARSIFKKYEGNAAVTAVLRRKPPRECRLMRMEIAAMLNGAR